MITTGVTGAAWRATITPWGAVEPWDDGGCGPLEWFVAADDRWHVPANEPTVRQTRVEGTPVTETRVRVPQGDAVQRVWSVADAGGLTIIEVTNESTLPIAVAYSHRHVLTERPIPTVPIEGLAEQGVAVPDDAFVVPVGHAAAVRIALVHGPLLGPDRLPAGLPVWRQVVRGWQALTERASRLVLPEPWTTLATAITAERCELALGAGLPVAGNDPAGFLIGLGELVRMGEPSEHWLPELAEAVAVVARQPGWDADAALPAARRVLLQAGEARAARDVDRIAARRGPRATRPSEAPDGVRQIAWVEQALADGPVVLPGGWPAGWLGQSWEAYGLPTVGRATVSLGVRWHGERPAVLWEQSGEPVELSAPAVAPTWTSTATRGESLWPAPP